MTDEQFFDLTPRQFFLLESRQKDKMQHAELLAGIIASTTANFSMAAPEKALGAEAFMPSHVPSKTKRVNKVDPAILDANNRAFFAKYVPELRQKP